MLSGRPPEIAVELLDPKERKDLRRRLKEWTSESAFAYLMDLLNRTKLAGDLRAEIALLKDLIDRGLGTATPAPIENLDLGAMIERAAAAVQAEIASRPALPPAPRALSPRRAGAAEPEGTADERQATPEADRPSTGDGTPRGSWSTDRARGEEPGQEPDEQREAEVLKREDYYCALVEARERLAAGIHPSELTGRQRAAMLAVEPREHILDRAERERLSREAVRRGW